MTELDKMKRAKMYIDKLANGANPLDDTVLPESDIVNNVRISRCFFFVSEIIERAIVSEERKMRRKVKLTPFELPVEKRSEFSYSDFSISISELVKRINDLIDKDTMSPLKLNSVTGWLVEIGMLRVEQRPDNKTVKRPTPYGNAIGITLEERMGRDGIYHAVIYNSNAQRFIIDNLDAVIEINNQK